jgi:AcrR family transcriptional regulator
MFEEAPLRSRAASARWTWCLGVEFSLRVLVLGVAHLGAARQAGIDEAVEGGRPLLAVVVGRLAPAAGVAGGALYVDEQPPRGGIAPGLVHHYFANKAELLSGLLDELVSRFRTRVRAKEPAVDPLTAYVDGAVGLDHTADLVAARCWVGLFAEAVREPALFTQVRRLVDTEIGTIQRRSVARLSEQDAGAVLAFVIGALVLGAFAPRKTAGFASPALRLLVQALLKKSGAPLRASDLQSGILT